MAKAFAFQVAEQIHIKQLRQGFAAAPEVATNAELLYILQDKKFLHVFDYGVVAFYGFDEVEMSDHIAFIKKHAEAALEQPLSDFIEVEVNDRLAKPRVQDDVVMIPDLSLDYIRIITLNLAQSVALDFYEELALQLLKANKAYVDELEENGRLKISKRNLLRFIGRCRNVKNSIVDNLYILDEPLITWEDPDLSRLNSRLKESFDIYNRFRDMDYKLRIIEENLTLFTDLIHHRESSRLEWIIIILILVEVVNLLLEKLL
ncbi:RMD1 family protein [Thermonema rossianum]|uniref:RMD1 family protein n=1 Tax=Thermonema rossianum TaxID=55505 RepID=UPI00057166F7|nr:RMD1 family protein [Thermonema rossianum]